MGRGMGSLAMLQMSCSLGCDYSVRCVITPSLCVCGDEVHQGAATLSHSFRRRARGRGKEGGRLREGG